MGDYFMDELSGSWVCSLEMTALIRYGRDFIPYCISKKF